ncbi:hypothetical protein ASD78_19110 [Lysobacter sp. Root667]|uniref:hypothetical protein n=1 Tax=Lysobacter sp. Root667 TaxID=1736581 RepID=UPI0006F3433D|nr:hypothetical protein [Lysobacter sp. Root667]KRA79689.1 hypothetical protein ASD78_19110 [Lysobacter sp. Root667]
MNPPRHSGARSAGRRRVARPSRRAEARALRLMPGELAWYVTGRFYLANDNTLADYGYFLHLSGIDNDLFNGERGETTAHFTFAARPFVARSASNGALQLGLDPIGEFSVFLQREPMGNFDDPGSFAQGECIATLRRTGMVVGTTVEQGITTPTPVMATNVFSARLLESRPFEFGGRRYDLAQVLGAGVTQFGTAAGTPATTPAGYQLAVPFTGSALALGAK